MSQTAVEWLNQQLLDRQNGKGDSSSWDEILEQAKEMEKNNIIESYEMGKNDGWNVRENDYNKNYHKEGTGLEWYNYRFKYVYGKIKN
jgi:hypothetical protein